MYFSEVKGGFNDLLDIDETHLHDSDISFQQHLNSKHKHYLNSPHVLHIAARNLVTISLAEVSGVLKHAPIHLECNYEA